MTFVINNFRSNNLLQCFVRALFAPAQGIARFRKRQSRQLRNNLGDWASASDLHVPWAVSYEHVYRRIYSSILRISILPLEIHSAPGHIKGSEISYSIKISVFWCFPNLFQNETIFHGKHFNTWWHIILCGSQFGKIL